MSRPSELKSPVGRFVAAFLGFIALIASGVVYLSVIDQAPPSKKAQAKVGSEETPETLFYKRLGTSPIVNDESQARGANAKQGVTDGYTLEIKVTETKEQAEQIIDSLREKGVSAYYTPIAVRGRVQYRVRFGVYHDVKKANLESNKILQAYQVKNRVIKLR